MKRTVPVQELKPILISKKGLYKRICPDGIIDHADTWENPVGNGNFANHVNYGPVIVIKMGAKKGLWIAADSIFCPGHEAYWRNLTPTYHDHM